MNKIFKIIKDLLYEADIFKYKFNFTFDNGKECLSTQTGKSLSISLFVILLILFLESDLITKSNSTNLIQDLNPETNPEISLNSENFNLRFGIYDQNLIFYPLDSSSFNLAISSMFYYVDPTLQQSIKIETLKKYQKCTNFSMYCLDDNNFFLKGLLNGKNTSLIMVKISLCDNSTSNNTCKPKEEINQFILGKFLAIWYQDFSINYDNYENPLSYGSNADLIICY